MTVPLLLVFYKIERYAKEPIISFEIFTRTSVVVNLVSFFAYIVLIGNDVYMPIYLQNILGYRPTISGLAMIPMSVSWLIMSFILGKLLIKYGEKAVMVTASAVLLGSTALLPSLGVSSPIMHVLIYGFVVGIGFGGVGTSSTMIVQDSVDYSKRGTAVAVNSLLRTLGQTIGVSVFGNIFNSSITKYFVQRGINNINPSNLYQSSTSQNAVSAGQIKLSLFSSIHALFIIFILIAGLSFVLSIVMPGIKGNGEGKLESDREY